MINKIKHMNKFVLIIIIILLITTIASFCYLKFRDNKVDSIKKAETKEEIKEEKEFEKVEKNEETEIKKEEQAFEETTESNSDKSNEETIIQDVKPNTNDKKDDNQNNGNNNQVAPPKEQTEWEKLGISEYDYYNSPVWSWQNVDFGVNLNGDKNCTNETDCLTKCQNYGEEYIKTHSGGYRCTNVLSHSGKYLGEDFEYFELQP